MRVYVLPGSIALTLGPWLLAFDGVHARWWSRDGGPVNVLVGLA